MYFQTLHLQPLFLVVLIYGCLRVDCGVDTFALAINFLNESWNLIHVTMGLFEVNETIGKSMVVWFKSILSKFGLMHCVIAFVKDEGNNLNTMATTLCFIIICQPCL